MIVLVTTYIELYFWTKCNVVYYLKRVRHPWPKAFSYEKQNYQKKSIQKYPKSKLWTFFKKRLSTRQETGTVISVENWHEGEKTRSTFPVMVRYLVADVGEKSFWKSIWHLYLLHLLLTHQGRTHDVDLQKVLRRFYE